MQILIIWLISCMALRKQSRKSTFALFNRKLHCPNILKIMGRRRVRSLSLFFFLLYYDLVVLTDNVTLKIHCYPKYTVDYMYVIKFKKK